MSLTPSSVKTLGPGEYTDELVTGLILRVRPGARGVLKRSFVYRCSFEGASLRVPLGNAPPVTLPEAREAAKRCREAREAGMDPRGLVKAKRPAPIALPAGAAVSSESARHKMEYVVGEFIELALRPNFKPAGMEWAERILNKEVLPPLKGQDIRNVSQEQLATICNDIARGNRAAREMPNGNVRKLRASKRTANQTHHMIKKFFGWARSQGKLVDPKTGHKLENPATDMTVLPGGSLPSRERTLSDAELRLLLTTPYQKLTRYERLYRVMRVLLLTGQRAGELAKAKWSELDLDSDSPSWTIPKENCGKNDKGHKLPLSPAAVAEFRILHALARAGGTGHAHRGETRRGLSARGSSRPVWVLPNPKGTGPMRAKLLSKGVFKCRKLLKAAGFKQVWTLHDLRRTLRTGLGELGTELHVAERVLNHSIDKLVTTYDRGDYFEAKRRALEAWATRLEALAA